MQLKVVVIVAVNDDGWLADKLSNTLEDVFFVGGVAKIPFQLFIQRQVRCQHEEVLDAFFEVQISDTGAHQAGLADTGCNGKSE